MANPVIQLRCYCNNYPWGKRGQKSLAARLCEKTPGTDFKIDDGVEYAEMWMGTYPTTPSFVMGTDKLLQDVLNEHKDELIGKTVLDKYGPDLPFLPKILSFDKALTLQLHPNKDLASQLHARDPKQFSDTNHKPEIAVAFGEFELFAGFKPLDTVQKLCELEPLASLLLSETLTKWTNETLRNVCRALFLAPEDTVKQVQDDLAKISKEQLGDQAYILDLLPRLQEQYSKADNGSLVALICMNFLTLQAGDAVYVPADGIHAYLSGDIFECMARSDNMLNVGFCPRADRDSVDTFTGALTFKSVSENAMLLPSKPADQLSRDGKTVIYAPALSEFNLLVTRLGKGEKEGVKAVNGPSIMIVLQGIGTMKAKGQSTELKEGFIFFIGQGVDVEFESREDLIAYRAYAD